MWLAPLLVLFVSSVGGAFYLIRNPEKELDDEDVEDYKNEIDNYVYQNKLEKQNAFHVVPYTLRDVMDWEDIISALKEIGYKGNMNFEIMPFVKQFPDALSEAAMSHVGQVARYFASRVSE